MANKLHELIKMEIYIYEVFQCTACLKKKFWLYTWDCKRLLKWLSHPLVTSLKGVLSFCHIYWFLWPCFFLPYVIFPISDRDDTELEILPYITLYYIITLLACKAIW